MSRPDAVADGPREAEALDAIVGDSGWESARGEAWDAFASAYASGWAAGCLAVFDRSSDGVLFYDGEPYDSSDCPSSVDPSINGDMPVAVPVDPSSEGYALGRAAGCVALYGNIIVTSLSSGTRTYTASDCATL